MIVLFMLLPNKIVYLQFHPVAYMIKLNIEMSMASLITRLARAGGGKADAYNISEHSHNSLVAGYETRHTSFIMVPNPNQAVARPNGSLSGSGLNEKTAASYVSEKKREDSDSWPGDKSTFGGVSRGDRSVRSFGSNDASATQKTDGYGWRNTSDPKLQPLVLPAMVARKDGANDGGRVRQKSVQSNNKRWVSDVDDISEKDDTLWI